MDELILVYVNYLGTNWRDNNIYEFIFSDRKEDIDGDDWDVYPASNGKVTPPNPDFIMNVGVLETTMTFDVIAESDTFSVWDCIDGITPLAYENIVEYTQYPEDRLVFHFGQPISTVKDILYSRDIILECKNVKDEN
jgi:hypothetical protein